MSTTQPVSSTTADTGVAAKGITDVDVKVVDGKLVVEAKNEVRK